jgi:phosphonate transport system permease protein
MTEIDTLREGRPRNRFLRWSLVALALLAAYAWLFGGLEPGSAFEAGRVANVKRFVGTEIAPLVGAWLEAPLWKRGLPALGSTVAMAVLAIVLAGAGGLALMLPGARTFASPEAYLPHAGAPSRASRLAWGALVRATRLVQLVLRAIPEYVWAFLLLAMFGPNAWPAVIALALHNAGILGKLGSETVENLEPGALRALRGMGAGRAQIAMAGILPASMPRLLLYFFYRFETCVRDATALGMLGMASLGYWIADARAKRYYDEMLFFVLLASAVVLAADAGSALARRAVRRAA